MMFKLLPMYIFNKAKKSLLEGEKGVDTSSTKAQQLVDYRMTNPDTNAVIVIHDPSYALIRGRQKGRPNKKKENHLVLLMKMSNKDASVEELIFDREYTVDDYAQAHHHALYLSDSDAMLLYVAWCTKEELRMATMFDSFWNLDTTPIGRAHDCLHSRTHQSVTIRFWYIFWNWRARPVPKVKIRAGKSCAVEGKDDNNQPDS
jgi:hypothetical protein